MRVDVDVVVAAPPERVWSVLVDWERQPAWMVDAVGVEVVGDRREGVGVELRCPTRVAGVTVDDRMVVTGWDPPRRLEVRHTGGLIRGAGWFDLVPVPAGTRVRWTEVVVPPLGPLGEAVARVAVAPYVRWLFGRSLRRLAALVRGGGGGRDPHP